MNARMSGTITGPSQCSATDSVTSDTDTRQYSLIFSSSSRRNSSGPSRPIVAHAEVTPAKGRVPKRMRYKVR